MKNSSAIEQKVEELSSKLDKTTQLDTFPCTWEGCGRLFRAQFSLNRHMILHMQTKRYTCRFCDRTFSLPQYLREHEYTHTKELPYECGVAGCRLKFRQAGKLSLHRRTHPEYAPKKYDYSLNKEKRTKTKQRQSLLEKPGNAQEKCGVMFKVTKVPDVRSSCIPTDQNDETKPMNSHINGSPAEDCHITLKPLPSLATFLSSNLISAQTHESPLSSMVHPLPDRASDKSQERVMPLLEYLCMKSEEWIKPVLPLPVQGNNQKRQWFCSLDLFSLIKNQEQ